MDNLRVASYLLELMKEYNRVSLPCLGSFIGNYQTSHVEKKNTIYPPYKKISFFQNEIWNDEKLEKIIAKTENISLGEAKEDLAFWIDEVCLTLATGGQIDLPDIGVFYVNKDNRLIFTQESEENLLMESFGLKTINLKPSEGVTFHPTPNIQLIENTKNKKKVGFKLIFIFILIFCGLCAAFIFLSIVKDQNTGIDKHLGLIPTNGTEKIVAPPIVTEEEKKVLGVTYRILVSEHEKYNEAKVKIKNLEQEGYTPFIYSIDQNNNKYGVCVGDFDTKTEAKYMLDRIMVLDTAALFKAATILSGSLNDKPL